jgi:Tfp pilus assembly protein PilP
MIKLIYILLLICKISLAQDPNNPGTMPSNQVNPTVNNQPSVDPGQPQGINSAIDDSQATAPTSEFKKEFNYNENEGRDPFKPYKDPNMVVIDKPTGEKTDQPQEEKVLVRNIKTIAVPADVVLLGIVYNKDNPVAAIKVIDGKTYYMRKQDSIGRYEGKIIDITRNTVVIQQARDFDGQKNIEKVVLKFKKNEQN